jgi:hypothetical protein
MSIMLINKGLAYNFFMGIELRHNAVNCMILPPSVDIVHGK